MLPAAIQRCGVEDHMVVDVLPVRVRCHDKGVLALGKAHSQFVAHLVSLLCADLTGSEGLPYLISNYIAFLPASVHKVVLPLPWDGIGLAHKRQLRFHRAVCKTAISHKGVPGKASKMILWGRGGTAE